MNADHTTPQGITRHRKVEQGGTIRSYSRDITRFQMVLRNLTRYHTTSQGIIRHLKASQDIKIISQVSKRCHKQSPAINQKVQLDQYLVSITLPTD